jgi:hypothetical protein
MTKTTPDPSKPAVRLASRIRTSNPNHHLFDNNGTWWCQVTVHRGPFSSRLRFSLKTANLQTARQRRDQLFASLSSPTPAA